MTIREVKYNYIIENRKSIGFVPPVLRLSDNYFVMMRQKESGNELCATLTPQQFESLRNTQLNTSEVKS